MGEVYNFTYYNDLNDESALYFPSLHHYGMDHIESKVGRGSGRYEWGSGERSMQRDPTLPRHVRDLKKQGYSEAEIADMLGFDSVQQMRNQVSIVSAQNRVDNYNAMMELYSQGKTRAEVSRILNIPESTLASMEKSESIKRAVEVNDAAAALIEQMQDGYYIDVGPGVENAMGVSRTKLDAAIEKACEEGGLEKVMIQVEQMGMSGMQKTTVTLLVPKGTPVQQVYDDVLRDIEMIQVPNTVTNYITDTTMLGMLPPVEIDKSRVAIRYAEDGGTEKDGMIEIKPGVEDLYLGDAHYAQCRILVKGDPGVNNKTEASSEGYVYLKGMAVINPDMDPDGPDIIFNCKYESDKPFEKVLKPVKDDPDNPFGASVRQCVNDNGQSAINIVGINEEGNWAEWGGTLPAQFLSKQTPALAKEQLYLQIESRKAQYEEIMAIENPIVRKAQLKEFAEACDANAINLKAAPLPGQQVHVLVPCPNMPKGEVYAPNYPDGTVLCLVRFPHEGRFEIPQVVVNNKNPEAKRLLGNSPDAIGVNFSTAAQLSGADFDGDTVIAIPNNDGKVKAESYLPGLVGFDTELYSKEKLHGPTSMENIPTGKQRWKDSNGVEHVTTDGFNKQMQMGMATNLITDMTIKGASEQELEWATKHAMVVIDAEKHNLDWKQSEVDNHIQELRNKYQAKDDPSKPGGGVSTLISRSTSEERIDEVKPFVYQNNTINKDTGEKLYSTTGRTREVESKTGRTVYTDSKTGEKYTLIISADGKTKEKVPVTGKTKIEAAKTEVTKLGNKLYSGGSAHELSSGSEIEEIYADFSDELYSLGNQARKEWVNTPNPKKDPEAAKLYSEEVASLKHKLDIAKSNAPKERKAQVLANQIVRAKKMEHPDADYETIKKWKGQALIAARTQVGAHKERIILTEREWEAINANAMSSNMVEQILNNMDAMELAKWSTPRETVALSAAQIARAQTMAQRGYTQAEIAQLLGVSVSTVNNAINE